MNKISIIIILKIILTNSVTCQKNNFLRNHEGIWIAKPFYDSFEKTHSISESRESFEPELPVGLRIKLKGSL